ncbi:MAG: four helix bundle protein [Chitinophagaceae bacterium]|nr:four helix bundle protein [Chitinophagaceae bacterium]MBP9740714.1 four helix bundle protein [Chitinophagaceae bacterium]
MTEYFSPSEKYQLTNQIIRSSRSITADIKFFR